MAEVPFGEHFPKVGEEFNWTNYEAENLPTWTFVVTEADSLTRMIKCQATAVEFNTKRMFPKETDGG